VTAWLRETGLGARVYFGHVFHLIRPGWPVPSYYRSEELTASLDGWRAADLQILVDEGRRQADAQLDQLEKIRGRAQWLFTLGLLLITALAGVGSRVLAGSARAPWWAEALWYASLVLVAYGGLGAAAIITVRGDFNAVDSWALSSYESPVLPKVAKDYAEMLRLGENTVNTRISVYRQAVVWTIAGGACGLAAWLWVVLDTHASQVPV